MAYTSYLYFIFFLGGTFLCYTVLPKKYKWTVLLGSSLVFYFLTSRTLLVFLLATTLSIYLAGLWMGRIQRQFKQTRKALPKEERKTLRLKVQRQKKLVVALALLLNFGCLALLKYYGFFSENVNGLLSAAGVSFALPAIRFLLPLGISFYTLQAAGYVIDVYRGKYDPDKNLGRLCLFLSFFAHIVEGPIGRYDQLAGQLYEGHAFNGKNVAFGLQRIVWGLLKKIVIADRANMVVKTIFDSDQDYGGIFVILGILLYTLQLYAEFSGCMDIVIGSAQLFGITLSENFKRPFFANTVNEFWRRWHITLGAWLREYVFYSVSLSKTFQKLSKNAAKRFPKQLAQLIPLGFALFFVWFGNGLWHGASWRYILYGLYYYLLTMLGLCFEPFLQRLLPKLHIRRESVPYRIFQIGRTFVLVNLGMLLFRANGVPDALSMFRSIFTGFSLNALTDGSLLKLGCDGYDYIILLCGVALLFVVGLLQEKGHCLRTELSQKNIFVRWPIYLAMLLAVVLLGAYGDGYAPVDFIYAQF